jgi:hypothetical protein
VALPVGVTFGVTPIGGSPATPNVFECEVTHQQPVNVEHRRHDTSRYISGQDERTPQFARHLLDMALIADKKCTDIIAGKHNAKTTIASTIENQEMCAFDRFRQVLAGNDGLN